MIDHNRRVRLADELLRRFASALRGAQLYAPGHPLVARNIGAFAETLALVTGQQRSITLGVVESEFVVGDVPLPRSSGTMGELLNRLRRLGVERIVVDRAVTREEIDSLVLAFANADGTHLDLPPLPHVQVGRIQVEQRIESALADMSAIRTSYREAVTIAERLWEQASVEGRPDPQQAREMVDTLAQAVAQNRTALVALTALKNYDNYTFTHMVNVSILTMAQARSLGIDGALLREFGLAGLMHDIGKVRTPVEILNKPERLTDEEFAIMSRHVIDGAEILRSTPEMPAIAPVVAFEHHLRRDGSGYPAGVRRDTLCLATTLCSISDVYDAMRSQRAYQQAFPTDRIRAVLERNDGAQFDQHLVRRFVQLIGIYPPGTLVRVDTGEMAVVLKVYAPDPHRPKVRVIADRQGHRLEKPYDVNLWDSTPGSEWPSSVIAPLDPAEHAIDPLDCL
ncbi:MAG TPA: HD-GYP domain-containing protein [Vicinamibacterales bacterium]